MKAGLKVLAVLAVAAAVVASAGAVWLWTENEPLSTTGTTQFEIPAGEPLGTTAGRLQQVGLVRSSILFRGLIQLSGASKSFPKGAFEVPLGLSSVGLAQWFRTATPIQVRLTIPEGWTASKIARLLEEKRVLTAGSFLDAVKARALEGTLFPDTYQFALNSTVDEVLRSFARNFDEKTSPLSRGLSPGALKETLVMASIIEREYRVPEEAPLIGSVFWNRLRRGIPLASCATIEYILTEIQGRPHPKRIFFVYTQIESPFNTYLNKGLPPQPICNPGLTALKAAFQPSDSSFLYFVVADPARGSHRFSSSYSDHEKARELYLSTYVSKN